MRSRMLLFPTVVVLLAFGFGDFERGNRLYREGRYAEAVEAYRAALEDGNDTPALHYNLGTALLNLDRYDEADPHLRAALEGIEPDVRTRAHYNLGNRFLQAARQTPDVEARRRLLEGAVEAYKRALRLKPNDRDAKWNLELALQEREELPPAPQGGPSQPQGQQSQQGRARGPAGPPSPTGSNNQTRTAGDPRELTREQAERILSAVEQDERDLFGEKLRHGRRETPVARDW